MKNGRSDFLKTFARIYKNTQSEFVIEISKRELQEEMSIVSTLMS
jgi:hypothetical protein